MTNKLWPLYGAGWDNFGPLLQAPIPEPGPDELLVRHDAVGICFSDIKVIRSGPDHPRIHHDMRREPVVLGHEVCLTVVQTGANLRDRFEAGGRYIVQADIYTDGVSTAYGYEIPGGFAQYALVDERVVDYLLPIQPTTGYAEAALMEPWACVEASYAVSYRTTWRPGGTVWLVGDGAGVELGRAAQWRPARVHLDVSDSRFADEVHRTALEVTQGPPTAAVDDVVVLGNDPELIESAFARAANGGVCAVITAKPLARKVSLDIGRLHYDNLAIVGATGPDLCAAYTSMRAQLKPGGRLWVLGAGGPLGRMHVQRALGTSRIVATSRRQARIDAVAEDVAAKDGVVWLAQETLGDGLSERLRAETGGQGFDDIAVMAPSAQAVADAFDHLADGGVMNMFAGLPRGTRAPFDLDAVIRRGVRFTGTSGSSIEDMRRVRDLTESGALAPNRSVAAIAGLDGVPDGLRAVEEGRFAGKVVIFPQLRLPLTPLTELAATLPTVAAKLDAGAWTAAAERELLHLYDRLSAS